jgi:hypothetical protein
MSIVNRSMRVVISSEMRGWTTPSFFCRFSLRPTVCFDDSLNLDHELALQQFLVCLNIAEPQIFEDVARTLT